MKNISEVLGKIGEKFPMAEKELRKRIEALLETVPRELEVHEGLDLGLHDIENWLEEAKK
jgi:hypothetical protein